MLVAAAVVVVATVLTNWLQLEMGMKPNPARMTQTRIQVLPKTELNLNPKVTRTKPNPTP